MNKISRCMFDVSVFRSRPDDRRGGPGQRRLQGRGADGAQPEIREADHRVRADHHSERDQAARWQGHKIDRNNLERILVPLEDARRVILAARNSAHARLCDLPELQAENYLA